MRREFPARVKEAAYTRAAGQCEIPWCRAPLHPAWRPVGRYIYDHRIPDWMGGEPTLENCQVICVACHKDKTREDRSVIAKSKRIRRKQSRIRKQTTFRGWRKFDGTPVRNPRLGG